MCPVSKKITVAKLLAAVQGSDSEDDVSDSDHSDTSSSPQTSPFEIQSINNDSNGDDIGFVHTIFVGALNSNSRQCPQRFGNHCDCFLLDSGANRHVTRNSSFFSVFTLFLRLLLPTPLVELHFVLSKVLCR